MSGRWHHQEPAPASLTDRIAASLIDSLIVAVISLLGVWAVIRPLQSLSDPAASVSPLVWFGPLIYALGVIVVVHWLWSWSADKGLSPGRSAMGLRLVGEDNLPPGYGKVAGRYFAKNFINGTGIGAIVNVAILAKNSPERSVALHDSLMGTKVVQAEASPGDVVSVEPPVAHDEEQFVDQDPGKHWPGYSEGMSLPEENPWDLPGQSAPTGADEPLARPLTGSNASLGAFVKSDDDVTIPAERANGHKVDSGHSTFGDYETSERIAPGVEHDVIVDLTDDADPYMQEVPLAWAVTLSDGQQVLIEDKILIGRNPVPPSEDSQDAAIACIEDTTRSISKTHALIGVDDDGLWILDCNSSNGTYFSQEGEWERLTPGTPYRLLEGDMVRFGEVDASVSVEENIPL